MCTPKAINSTPNTANQNNAPDTPQVDPPEYLTWDHEGHTEGHVTHYRFVLTH